MGPRLVQVAKQQAGAAATDLLDAVRLAPRDERSCVGLLLARLILQDAGAASSKPRLNDFLFRFAAHLQASVNDAGLSPDGRRALAEATGLAFARLPSATAAQKQSVADMQARLGEADHENGTWLTSVGLSFEDFVEHLDAVAAAAAPTRPLSSTSTQAVGSALTALPPTTPQRASSTTTPSWLLQSFSQQGDSLVVATANWLPTEFVLDGSWNPAESWSAFEQGQYANAVASVEPLLAGLGAQWLPNATADGLRFWHWLRLLVALARLETGGVTDQRRAASSAFVLAMRSVPDNEALLAHLLSLALEDFIASDIASRQAWNAYTIRVVHATDHEFALQHYDNQEKAELRSLWSDLHRLLADEARSTASALNALLPRFHAATQTLYSRTRQGVDATGLLRQAVRDLAPFLDEGEQRLLRVCSEQGGAAEAAICSEPLQYDTLEEVANALHDLIDEIAVSESILLQDYLAPLATSLLGKARLAKERLKDTSRPAIEVRLDSPRLPFSAAEGTPYQVRLLLANTGNATAADIQVLLQQEELSMRLTSEVPQLGAGAEQVLEVGATATGFVPQAVQLNCAWSWTDSLQQRFSSHTVFAAEDQRPPSWTPEDVNPYTLGTISEPARLVGRQEDLASLEALLAGGGSASITGHKRVGKTSLTRVLLRRTAASRGWAGDVLPLGRALGPEQSAADLVYAMLDQILDTVIDAYPGCSEVLAVVPDDHGNFARAANRWLRGLARRLPRGARVVLAIDDFDELPPHLTVGPQADTLFLFLRSLVDEPWLSLVLIGSEILPTLMASQSHKLNQVVPVSVTNFSSRASTKALLLTPTADRLEWDGLAVDRMHYLCGGNPYYETLVAQQLWLELRERLRSFVTETDIEQAARAVAEAAPASHFVHLWADSASGIDHTSRRAVVTSAILRAVARCGGTQGAPAQIEEALRVAQTWIPSATETELQQVLNALVGRDVLSRQSVSTVALAIPLVNVWLRAAGAKSLNRTYSESAHASPVTRVITETDLAALSRGLLYRGEPISEIRIKAWLTQFGDSYHQYLAYQMLRRMILDGYFSATRMNEKILPRLRDAVLGSSTARQVTRDNNGYMKNAYLLEHGVSGDSTQGTISSLCKTLKIKKANVISPADVATRFKPDTSFVLFVLDDFSGSGRHLQRVVEELSAELPRLGDNWEERVQLVVGAAVVVDAERLPKGLGPQVTLERVSGFELGLPFRAFDPAGAVFESAKELKDAEDLVTTIGRALMPNMPLGFGHDALLSVFEFNCPNNVAPIFWRRGNYAGQEWFPLFERVV